MRVTVICSDHDFNTNNAVKHNCIAELTGYVSFWSSGRLALSETAF